MSQSKKLYFFESPVRYGYFAGQTYTVPADQADYFLQNGIARLATEVLPVSVPARNKLIAAGIETEEDLHSIKHIPSKVNLTQSEAAALEAYLSEEKGEAIPKDIPGYDHLVSAGVTTVDQILNYEDLTKIKGIGEATAKDILEFLSK